LKRLEVRLAEQLVVAYEDNQPVFMARAATGAKFSNGDFRTPPGEYITNRKRPSRHMASGDRAAANSYDLPGVPWVCYITESGIAFHGTYWHNDFGKPRSHGCINVSSDSARWIYRWTFPSVSLDKQTHNDETGTFVQVI
jgi:lipoprotein-anchoring transpeptidase ErfK/SrfK